MSGGGSPPTGRLQLPTPPFPHVPTPKGISREAGVGNRTDRPMTPSVGDSDPVLTTQHPYNCSGFWLTPWVSADPGVGVKSPEKRFPPAWQDEAGQTPKTDGRALSSVWREQALRE